MPKRRAKPRSKLAANKIQPSPGAVTIKGFAPTLGPDVYSNLPDDHKVYAALGRAISEWANLEHVLDMVIADLSRLDYPTSACISAQILGATYRIDAITALVIRNPNLNPSRTYNKDHPVIKTIASFRGSVEGPQAERNRLVHDPWFLAVAIEEPAQFKSMPRKEWIYGLKPTPTDDVDALVTAIRSLVQEAKRLRSYLLDALSS